MRATIVYSLQRAALFLTPFLVMLVAQVPWYIALVVALLFAFCASYIFLRGSRDAAIAEIAAARGRRAPVVGDEESEDAARDRADAERDGDEAAPSDREPASTEPTPASDADPQPDASDPQPAASGPEANDPVADDDSDPGATRR